MAVPWSYMLGVSEETGHIKPNSAVHFLVSVFEFLAAANNPLLKEIYDLDLEQWGLPRQPGEPLVQFLRRIANHTAFILGEDNAGYDLSIQGATPVEQYHSRASTHVLFLVQHEPDYEDTHAPVFPSSAEYQSSSGCFGILDRGHAHVRPSSIFGLSRRRLVAE